jgi:dnd system-associated protein 4
MDNILKLPVRRSDAYEKLVVQYCATKDSQPGEKKVFNTIKDFMVFAALIGFQLNKSKVLDGEMTTTSIILETYATTKHDAYIYLIALAKNESLDILKDENLRNAINIFEGFCNAGLEHINKWVFDNIGQHISEDILFNQTLDYLLE